MKVVPWSHSSLQAYENCPRAFYEIKVAKNYKEDWNTPQLLWGNEVHKALELYVGHGTMLPARMVMYQNIGDFFRNAPGVKLVEHETAITIDGTPTGYWDTDAWHRGKDDIKIIHNRTAIVADYKTGKHSNDDAQLRLAAVRLFANHEEVQTVHSAYMWLQTGKMDRKIYTRDNIPAVIDEYKARVRNMEWSEQNNAWPAKPSGLCKRSKKPGSTYGGCIVASCPHSEHYKGR